MSREETAELLTGHGIPCHAAGYGHVPTPDWRIVRDGSLSDGGMELVSPVLDTERGGISEKC